MREPDATIRLTHVETLLLLCHTRWGRDYQRQHGVYEIVRATHEHETVDKVCSTFFSFFLLCTIPQFNLLNLICPTVDIRTYRTVGTAATRRRTEDLQCRRRT
jgi:hypothetical protein